MFFMRFTKHIPNILTISRFFISFLLILDAIDGYASQYFTSLFIFGALTDFLDGFIARKFNAMTIRGTILDGYADIALYCSALFSIWFLFPNVIKKHLFSIAGLILIQIFSWAFSYYKFRRITSYHTYSAKIWGIMLFISFAFLFAFSNGLLLIPMFIIAAVSIIEDIIITSILPYWKSEIKYFIMAIYIREKYLKTQVLR
jgi:CDP-diacylglycerol--glycerol-3-phosphate 3-phosphatidyltransferase